MTKLAASIFALSLSLFVFDQAGCQWFKTHPIVPSAPDGGYADASANAKFVDCSDAALHATEMQILPAIETALATQDYAGSLAILVGKYGLAEVACGVQWVIDKAHGQYLATGDTLEMAKANNGRVWLASQGVTFAGAGAP